jgi:hypothetical protein
MPPAPRCRQTILPVGSATSRVCLPTSMNAIGRITVNLAHGILLLAAASILAVPSEGALLALPVVPHHDFDAFALPPPPTSPRYLQSADEAQHKSNTNDQEGHRRTTLRDRLALIWEKTTDDPVAFFTFWLAIFTLVLAFSTIGLWIVTWRSSVRQSREMRASIKAAEDTAVAAQINAEAARKSSEAVLRHERPYVFPSHERIATRDDGSIVVRYGVRNFGRTPAIIREVGGKFVPDGQLPLKPDYAGGESHKLDHVVLPGERLGEEFDFPIFDETNQFFAMWIRYNDVTRTEYTSRALIRVSPSKNECRPELDARYADYHRYS